MMTIGEIEDFADRYAKANSDDENVRRQIRIAVKATYNYLTTGDVDGKIKNTLK
jgi:hypothetical protein